MARSSKKNLERITAENSVAEVKTCTTWGDNRKITMPVEIDYYHEYIKQIIIKNRLVGNVTDGGEYEFGKVVKQDLVKMPKEVADECPSYYLAMAVFKNKTFNFIVDIEYSLDDMATASLYLNESVVDYPPVTTLRTFVAKIVIPADEHIHDKIYEAFHLVKATVNVKDDDVPALAVLIDGQANNQLLFDEISDLGSQIYIMRTLKMLSKAGPVGQKMLDEYKEKVKELKPDVNKKGTYTKLHRELDRAIQKHGGVEALPLDKETVSKPMKEYTDSIKKLNNVKAKTIAVDPKTLNKGKDNGGGSAPAKKPAAKAGSSSKKAGKKDGGDKKKKKSDKKDKDDKKEKKGSSPDYIGSVVTTFKSLGLDGGNKSKTPIYFEPTEKPTEKPATREPEKPAPVDDEEFDALSDAVVDLIVGDGEDIFDNSENIEEVIATMPPEEITEQLNQDFTKIIEEVTISSDSIKLETIIVEEELQ